MKRSEVVVEGARLLHASERALDTAFAQTASLAAGLAELRIAGNLSAVIGQEAFDEVAAAMGAVSSARARIVRTHEVLAGVQIRIGCRTVATGGESKDDPEQSALPTAGLISLAAA
jgi:hypothetical protein